MKLKCINNDKVKMWFAGSASKIPGLTVGKVYSGTITHNDSIVVLIIYNDNKTWAKFWGQHYLDKFEPVEN